MKTRTNPDTFVCIHGVKFPDVCEQCRAIGLQAFDISLMDLQRKQKMYDEETATRCLTDKLFPRPAVPGDRS